MCATALPLARWRRPGAGDEVGPGRPPPTASEIDALTARLADRILTGQRSRGLLEDEAAENSVDDEATLASGAGASVQGVIAFGDQPGARVERAGQAEEGLAHSRHEVHGFSLHASEPVPAEDRERLERLIRYTARPPVPDERVSRRRHHALLVPADDSIEAD